MTTGDRSAPTHTHSTTHGQMPGSRHSRRLHRESWALRGSLQKRSRAMCREIMCLLETKGSSCKKSQPKSSASCTTCSAAGVSCFPRGNTPRVPGSLLSPKQEALNKPSEPRSFNETKQRKQPHRHPQSFTPANTPADTPAAFGASLHRGLSRTPI